MCADSENNEPFWFNRSLVVVLAIAQNIEIDGLLCNLCQKRNNPIKSYQINVYKTMIAIATLLFHLTGRDLLGSPVTDEEGLASPLVRHILSLWDVAKIDFDLGQGQNIGGSGHAHNKLRCHGFAQKCPTHASTC